MLPAVLRPVAGSRVLKPLVVTLCSASKRCRGANRPDILPRGDQASVAAAWLALVADESHLTPAQDTYKGRAFAMAADAAQGLGADLGIVSAGLGYVRAETPIPAYDLTVRATGPGAVASRVEGLFDFRRWFEAVSSGPYAEDFGSDLSGRPLVLVCLARDYSRMIADDLVAFVQSSSVAGASLRIFGLSLGPHLPEALRGNLLPYDERLGLNEGRRGTRVDFAQRALSHYAERVRPETASASLAKDREAVLRAMSRAGDPLGPRRHHSVKDGVVRAAIVRLAGELGPGRGRMLNHLRHQEGISCEQARFSRLYAEVMPAKRLDAADTAVRAPALEASR